MEEMKSETTFTGKHASINLDVPSGPNREFTVEIENRNGGVLYSGTATRSLDPGTPVTVSVPVVRKATSADLGETVLIPAGEFEMGDHFNEGGSNEKPVHTVYLNAFYIDKYEVTSAQYAKFLNAVGKHKGDNGNIWLDIGGSSALIELVGGEYRPKSGYENHPVIEVSWYGATAYAEWAGKRLPTEAEWEKAARGGLVGKRYPWGDEISHDDANYWGTGGRDKWTYTSPVGSFPPNSYGLYDMAGNVWEWCADWYDSGYYSKSPRRNPKGPDTGTSRVWRGGSWGGHGRSLRATDRHYHNPLRTRYDVGFRCVAQDLTP